MNSPTLQAPPIKPPTGKVAEWFSRFDQSPIETVVQSFHKIKDKVLTPLKELAGNTLLALGITEFLATAPAVTLITLSNSPHLSFFDKPLAVGISALTSIVAKMGILGLADEVDLNDKNSGRLFVALVPLGALIGFGVGKAFEGFSAESFRFRQSHSAYLQAEEFVGIRVNETATAARIEILDSYKLNNGKYYLPITNKLTDPTPTKSPIVLVNNVSLESLPPEGIILSSSQIIQVGDYKQTPKPQYVYAAKFEVVADQTTGAAFAQFKPTLMPPQIIEAFQKQGLDVKASPQSTHHPGLERAGK